MKPNLRKFLAEPAKRGQCRTCADKSLDRDVVAFLDARRGGNEHTWAEFYERLVRRQYANAPGETSMRRHVRQCLGRDHITGKDLA